LQDGSKLVKGLTQILWKSALALVPKGKFRWQLLALVMIAAAIPVTELLVAKLFTDLVVQGAGKPPAELLTSILLFVLLFAGTRVANYLQKTFRVGFFDRAFGASEQKKSPHTESWEWAMALELVNVLSFLMQMFVIAGFFFFLDLGFGALNLLFIIIVLQVMGRLFVKQFRTQREFVKKKRAKEVVTPAERLGVRIQQAEVGTLFASGGLIMMFASLLAFSLTGLLTLSNTIVFFLGLRLQNTTFSSISSALMRFARAKANSF
jgi:hypothetical protein